MAHAAISPGLLIQYKKSNQHEPAITRFVIIPSFLLPAISAQSTNLTTAANAANLYYYPLWVFTLPLGLLEDCADFRPRERLYESNTILRP